MDKNTGTFWKNFMNPEVLRSNLIVASLFVTAFEILKNSVIERVRDFFIKDLGDNKRTGIKRYKNKVLSLHKNRLCASLKWLKNMGAIDNKDIEEFKQLRKHRNKIAHEMVNLISSNFIADSLSLFPKVVDLISKIEKWWILNLDIPMNPDFDGKEIDEEEFIPGKVILVRLLASVALGSKEELRCFHERFVKHQKLMAISDCNKRSKDNSL